MSGAAAFTPAVAAISSFVKNNAAEISNVAERITPEFARPLVKNTFSADIKNTGRAIDSLQKGNIGGALKPYVERAKTLQAQATGKDQQAPVNIAAPVDVAAEQENAKKERARAKRQAEIDILTDRPGRGGTILTDQYTYKV